MALETKKVLNFSEIPNTLSVGHWLGRNLYESYVEIHLDEEVEDDLGEWIVDTYPELIEEDSFFIYMDK
jgi:hypothetical protein